MWGGSWPVSSGEVVGRLPLLPTHRVILDGRVHCISMVLILWDWYKSRHDSGEFSLPSRGEVTTVTPYHTHHSRRACS